jgi:ABC-2 type transport system permease protein
MTWILVCKLLRDIRLPLLVVALLLGGFQCLWAKITERITADLVPFFSQKIPLEEILSMLFSGPGKVIQTLMGGESINLDRALDMLTVGYVHPLMQTVFGVWAIGRAAGSVSGEINRGTMELLMAQPFARFRLILAHCYVDLLTIPALCLSLWGGTWLGTWLVGLLQFQAPVGPNVLRADPTLFWAALPNIGALMFALSGYTMWLSSRGRSYSRVLGVAILIGLLQFLVNVVGQMWDTAACLRPFTVFFYFQPQQTVLSNKWSVDLTKVWHLSQPLAVNAIAVLAAVGLVGYGLALWTFCRRDLPAPL